jgi:large subunit ribosomal protein L10
MNPDKKIILDDLLARINSSPFLLVVDYGGLKVAKFQILRDQLAEAGAECHVTKNSYLKIAAKEVSFPEDFASGLGGQIAIVTGESDVCAAAKVIKTFSDGSGGKPESKLGVLDGNLLDAEQILGLAALPPKDVLLAKLLGVLQAPASQFVRTLNEPGASLARVLQAKADQG